MFIPRLSKPNNYNKYYIKAPQGYNPCILGNTKHRDKVLNVLPNCVGYACGRFSEIGDYGCCKYNINMNAKDIFSHAKSLGLKTGVVPQVGALIVWGNLQYGHVAVVEEVISQTEIKVSESGWSSANAMWVAVHRKGTDGNWLQGTDYYWMKGKYAFLGFVYNPAVQNDSIMKQQTMKVLYNGTELSVTDNYMADGKNYPAVAELMRKMGKEITWDGKRGLVIINDK